MTFTEFAVLHAITVNSIRIKTKRNGFRWQTTLDYAGKAHTLKYFKGSAHVGYPVYKNVLIENELKRIFDKWVMLTSNQLMDYEKCIKKMIPYNNITRRSQPIPPQVNEVLESLQLDCSTVCGTLDFADWANELGYDSDSIKDKKIFKKCRKTVGKLKQLFGLKMFEQLLECTED